MPDEGPDHQGGRRAARARGEDRLRQAGQIPAFKIRGQWRIKRTELDQWIDAQPRGGDGVAVVSSDVLASAASTSDPLAVDWLRGALGLDSSQAPFPWQVELLRRFRQGEDVSSLDIPTGLGKTAVMAVWLVARALRASLTGGFKPLSGYLQTLAMISAERCVFLFEGMPLMEIPRLPVRLSELDELREHAALFRRLAVGYTVRTDDATGRLFGHYDASGVFVFDRLAGHLP